MSKMENYLSKNQKQLTNMLFETLDLIPVSDAEARNHFKAELSSYVHILFRVNDIHNLLDYDKVMKQYQFSQKLFTLCDRYKSGGLPQNLKDNPTEFIRAVQAKMLEVCEDGFSTELRKAEAKDAYDKAYGKLDEEVQTGRLSNLKENALKNINKTKQIIKGLE
jgi:hypothetical protein